MAPQIRILFSNVCCMKSTKYRTFHIQIEESLEMYDWFTEVRKNVKVQQYKYEVSSIPQTFQHMAGYVDERK